MQHIRHFEMQEDTPCAYADNVVRNSCERSEKEEIKSSVVGGHRISTDRHSVCLSSWLCLSVYLSVRPPGCPSVFLSLSLHLSLCLSTIYFSTCLSICLLNYVSVCVAICLFICLCICLAAFHWFVHHTVWMYICIVHASILSLGMCVILFMESMLFQKENVDVTDIF
jgi:hypothetical protein